jgi:hypothetical protein
MRAHGCLPSCRTGVKMRRSTGRSCDACHNLSSHELGGRCSAGLLPRSTCYCLNDRHSAGNPHRRKPVRSMAWATFTPLNELKRAKSVVQNVRIALLSVIDVISSLPGSSSESDRLLHHGGRRERSGHSVTVRVDGCLARPRIVFWPQRS